MQQLLNQTQRNFLKTFRRNKLSEYFYWGGGTLLAYHYLHHRFSEDLDFFSNELLFDETMATAFLEFKKNTGAKKLNRLFSKKVFFSLKKCGYSLKKKLSRISRET